MSEKGFIHYSSRTGQLQHRLLVPVPREAACHFPGIDQSLRQLVKCLPKLGFIATGMAKVKNIKGFRLKMS